MAATLIVYMKGEQRKADEEKVRRAKEGKAKRGEEAMPGQANSGGEAEHTTEATEE